MKREIKKIYEKEILMWKKRTKHETKKRKKWKWTETEGMMNIERNSCK